MANQIALNYNVMPLILNALKTGTPQKTKVYTESKTVIGKSLKFAFSDPRATSRLPSHRKTSLFVSTG